MILVDSSVWIDYFRGADTQPSRHLAQAIDQAHPRLLVGDLIMLEVLQGFRNERQAHTALQAFDLYDQVTLGGRDAAVQSARNYRLLRAKGITVRSSLDCLIATFCIENDLLLLHNDRDYDPFQLHLGLRVVQ